MKARVPSSNSYTDCNPSRVSGSQGLNLHLASPDPLCYSSSVPEPGSGVPGLCMIGCHVHVHLKAQLWSLRGSATPLILDLVWLANAADAKATRRTATYCYLWGRIEYALC